MGKFQRLLARTILALLPLLTACGQISPLGQSSSRAIDTSALLTSYSPQSDTEGSCRYNDIVVPDNDTWLDGTGYYKVCPSSTDSGVVTIFGQAPNQSKQYCVFPAQVISGGSIYPKIDTQGIPLMSCSQKALAGQIFTFDRTNYNALFIVPYADRNAMQMCLGLGNYHQCPKSFSYGQFRD